MRLEESDVLHGVKLGVQLYSDICASVYLVIFIALALGAAGLFVYYVVEQERQRVWRGDDHRRWVDAARGERRGEGQLI